MNSIYQFSYILIRTCYGHYNTTPGKYLVPNQVNTLGKIEYNWLYSILIAFSRIPTDVSCIDVVFKSHVHVFQGSNTDSNVLKPCIASEKMSRISNLYSHFLVCFSPYSVFLQRQVEAGTAFANESQLFNMCVKFPNLQHMEQLNVC